MDSKTRAQLADEVRTLRRQNAALQEVHKRLRQDAERYRAVAQTAFAGICITDPDENLVFVNPAFAEMLGYAVEDLEGANLSQLTDAQEFARFCNLTRQRRQGLRNSYESHVYCKDGRRVDTLVSASPLPDRDDCFSGILSVIIDISERRRLAEENRLLRRVLKFRPGFEGIVAKSQAMQRVLDLVEKIADSESSVLIEGETGTGKELVAQCLHRNSARCDHPFVPIDCGALPDQLIESELFGHERGAFTGAHGRKTGLLEAAQGGTVFLDEIANLSVELQAKLLRVLQERALRRVGGRELIDIDIRLIAATNEGLDAAIEQGRFRRDLYYRLNVITVSLPPLRQRREDIPLLVDHFIKELNEKNRAHIEGISLEALDRLQEYPWPGNVRELHNVIERAFFLADSPLIGPALLPSHLSAPAQVRTLGIDAQMSFREAKKSSEKAYLRALLGECGGNVSRAAQHAGIHRSSLQRLLKKHGMRSREFHGK